MPTEQELLDKIKSLEENQSKQNAYITKLEKIVNGQQTPPPAQPTPVAASGIDQTTTKYIQRKMREDAIKDGLATLSKTVRKEIIDILTPELEDFLKDSMTPQLTNEKYVINSFHLVYGQAMANGAHAIHKLAPAQQTPPPANQQTPPPAQQGPFGQTPPPSISGKDNPAVPGVPNPENPNPIRSTRDAFAGLRGKISGMQ